MNSHQRKIYASQLQHAERRNHKYLYKIGDRYVYPEDVSGKAKSTASNIGSMVTATGTAAKTKINKTIADQKQKLKDKKFVKESEKLKKKDVADEHGSYDEWLKSVNKHNAATDKGKQVNQISSAHTRSTVGIGPHLLSYQKGEHGTTANLEKQKAKTAERKEIAANREWMKERKKINQQANDAHRGYYEDQEKFPDGGSTEELERQKKKTADRKKAKELTKKKEKDQIRSAHQQNTIRERRKSMPGPASAPSLETKKKESEYRKYMKAYPKQKYSANQAEYDRQVQSLRNHRELIEEGRYPHTPSLEKQIEKTKKRKKAKQVRALYNN